MAGEWARYMACGNSRIRARLRIHQTHTQEHARYRRVGNIRGRPGSRRRHHSHRGTRGGYARMKNCADQGRFELNC